MIAGYAPQHATVLDAGCGVGQYAEEFATRGLRVVAVDRAPELIAARRYPGAAQYLVGTLESLPFDACFDLAFSRGVLNDLIELTDLQNALAQITKALKFGGLFIADVREEKAHRLRVEKYPDVVRQFEDVTFRSLRTMDAEGFIRSEETFSKRDEEPVTYIFKMRTFERDEIVEWFEEAGMTVRQVLNGYGPNSRMDDRLVIIGGRRL
jgi:SAM-dependent methyltransferase